MILLIPETRRDVLKARIGGGLYLIVIVTGLFALVVRSSVTARGDAAATAANILANESLYRLGFVSDLIMLGCYLGVTVILYEVFRQGGRSLSRLAAIFSLIGIAVLAVNSMNHLGPVVLLRAADQLSAFTADQLQTIALMHLKMHGEGYSISSVFFGVYCFLLGQLILRSALVPRIIGVLLMIGSSGWVVDSFTTFLSPSLGTHLYPWILLPGFVAELSLCLWLMIRGVSAPAGEPS